MPFTLCQEEIIAIQDYLYHPERYLAHDTLPFLSNGALPEGTKISRVKFSDTGNELPRHYIIPRGVHDEEIRMPITTVFANDPGEHSATLLQGNIFFHQNKHDLPKLLPHNFNVFYESDDDDVVYRTMWEQIKAKPNYAVDQKILGQFKKTVKCAIDSEGHLFYLKSHSSFIDGEVPMSNLTEQFAPQLYMGSPVFRLTFFSSALAQIKRIDVTRHAGDDLAQFLLAHGDNLSAAQIELLAAEIIRQYLVQINYPQIIHSDIKSTNICVKKTENELKPFDITFIDFDEAFRGNNTPPMGNGTPSYMAPEFFRSQLDFERQEENAQNNIQAYARTRKPDYRQFFSKASDVFALGVVLLRDLQLNPDSHWYDLACSMCQIEPMRRPSGDEIHQALDTQQHPRSMATDLR